MIKIIKQLIAQYKWKWDVFFYRIEIKNFLLKLIRESLDWFVGEFVVSNIRW